jgi:hypothetical protein
MVFRFFFSEQASQATKGLAKGSLVLGLLLIGFGMLVFVLRDIFALLAAAIFFIGGFSSIGYAIKLFVAAHRMRRGGKDPDGAYRENVNIRVEEFGDM